MNKVGGRKNLGYGRQSARAGKQALRDGYGSSHYAAHAERWVLDKITGQFRADHHDRIVTVVELARHFRVRFREASLFSARQTFQRQSNPSHQQH